MGCQGEHVMAGDPLIKIVVEDQTITCRKSVLVQESDYFEAMFTSNMSESQSNVVTLQDQKYNIVSKLVHCMETGELKLEDDVTDLLQAAVIFQVSSAQTPCVNFLLQTLEDHNCLSIMKLASLLCIHSLYSDARRHALYFFNKVCMHGEFLDLPVDDIVDYLSDRHLNCLTEVNVLDAIGRWNEANSYDQPSLTKVLSCFYAEDVRHREWTTIMKHPMLTNTEAGRTWLHKQLTRDRHTDCVNQYRSLPVMFVSVGGQNLVDDQVQLCTDIGLFNEHDGKFVPYQDLKDIYKKMNAKMGFSVTVVGKDVYLSGGLPSLTRAKFEMKVWRFDSFTEQWDVVTEVRSGRRHQGSCASMTCLYLLGGFNMFRDILNTFESYDTVNDTWKDYPPMPEKLICPKCSYHDNNIYLSSKDSLYLFDFNTDQWSKLLSQSVMQPVIWDDHIYNFKHVDEMEEIGWFGGNEEEVEQKQTLFVKYDFDTLEECEVQGTSKLLFGNEVLVINRRFYMLQCSKSGKFVSFINSGAQQEVDEVEVLGGRGVAGRSCRLLALPRYPKYKVPGC